MSKVEVATCKKFKLFTRMSLEVMSSFKMHTTLRFLFIFALFLHNARTLEIFPTGEHVELDKFLKLFQNCTVNIYNLENKLFHISSTPILIQTNNFFEVTQLFRYPSKTPFEYHCLAIVHILPNGTFRKDRDSRKRYPTLNTELRYDVIIEDTSTTLDTIWRSTYYPLLTKDDFTNGLILEIPILPKSIASYPLCILNKLAIVNRYRISSTKRVTKTVVNLKQIVKNSKRKYLDQIVMDIQSLENNPDIQWSIRFTRSSTRNFNGKRIQDLLKRNTFLMGNLDILLPSKVSEERMRNFLFAFLALGTDINVTEFSNPQKLPELFETQPQITFDVENGPIMMDRDSKEFGLLSCSKNGTPTYHRYTFQGAVVDLLSIFEKRVYLAIFLSYGVPAFVLGVIYHAILKKHLKKNSWIKWHPFTWGLRALIWQAGDRTLSSLRFGWTTFMVIPWLLMAVVLSHTFRENVLSVISMSGRLMYTFTSIGEMYQSNWSVITDIVMLAMKGKPYGRFERYVDIAHMVATNDSITYLSGYERVLAVANIIGHSCDSVPLKVRKVYSGELYFFGWRLVHEMTTDRRGWMISNVFDQRLFAKLSRLEFDSGIVGKWNQVIKRASKFEGSSNFKLDGYARPLCLTSNVLYLFFFGASCLGGAILVWFLERIAVFFFPRKKPVKQMALQKPVPQDIQLGLDKPENITTEPSDNLEENLINEAIALVDERRRSLAYGKPGLQVSRIELESGPSDNLGKVDTSGTSKVELSNESNSYTPNIGVNDEDNIEGDSNEMDKLESVLNPQNISYVPRDHWDDINDILGDTMEGHGVMPTGSEQRIDT